MFRVEGRWPGPWKPNKSLIPEQGQGVVYVEIKFAFQQKWAPLNYLGALCGIR
jgi:hypothetical protein